MAAKGNPSEVATLSPAEVRGFVKECSDRRLSETEATVLLRRASLAIQSPAFIRGFVDHWEKRAAARSENFQPSYTHDPALLAQLQ